MFSAKESVYKAWYQLTLRPLGFDDATVRFRTDDTFTASLLVPGPLLAETPVQYFHGRWTQARGLLLTAVLLPAVTLRTDR